MPKQPRISTKYQGVFAIEGVSNGKPERIYYIRYRKEKKLIEEKVGFASHGMTPARASHIRAERIAGKRQTNSEKRQAEDEARKADESRWTVTRLWDEYKANRPNLKGIVTDENRFQNYVRPAFGDMLPSEIDPLSVDRLRVKLLKKKSTGTVKNVLELLRRVCNYGVKKNLTDGLSFTIEMPRMNNVKTEDLTADELEALLKAIDEDEHPQAGTLMKMVLYTGMRRTELFKLKWADIDETNGFIKITDPKGGIDQKIPLNDAARDLLKEYPSTGSPYVFPGRNGGQRVDIHHQVNRIRDDAGLPKDFRALHGLRHVYASMLISSGKVDLYTLQRLLTHKSPSMTMRYAHLRDQALQDASQVAGDIVNGAMKGKKEQEKVVNIHR
jgi:integrase